MSLETHRQHGTNPPPSVGMLCSRCNAVVKPGKKFCSQCGCPARGPLPGAPGGRARPRPSRSTICPECSFENHHSDRFCKGCGGLLIALPPRLSTGDAAGRDATSVKAITASDAESGRGLGIETTPRSLAAGRPVTIDKRANDTPLPAGPGQGPAGTTASRAGQAASSPWIRLRPLGVATGVIAVVAILVLLATQHDAWRGSGENSQLPTISLPPPPAPPITATGSSTPTAAAQVDPSAGSAAAPSRGTVNAGRTQRPFGASTGKDNASSNPARPAAADGGAPATHKAVAITPIPNTTTAGVDAAGSSAVKAPSAPSSIPGPDAHAEATPQVTVASLLVSLPPSAEAEAERGEAPSSEGRKLRVGGVVQPARLLAHSNPAYPADARAQRVEGTVHLIGTVRTDGTLGDLKVASGDTLLADAALHAVRDWRYQPALLDGQPIQSQTDIEIKFHLPGSRH
jgi:TonB family protein